MEGERKRKYLKINKKRKKGELSYSQRSVPSTWTLPLPLPSSWISRHQGSGRAEGPAGLPVPLSDYWGQELRGGDVPSQADMLLVFEASPAHHQPTCITPYDGAFHWHEVSRRANSQRMESGDWQELGRRWGHGKSLLDGDSFSSAWRKLWRQMVVTVAQQC